MLGLILTYQSVGNYLSSSGKVVRFSYGEIESYRLVRLCCRHIASGFILQGLGLVLSNQHGTFGRMQGLLPLLFQTCSGIQNMNICGSHSVFDEGQYGVRRRYDCDATTQTAMQPRRKPAQKTAQKTAQYVQVFLAKIQQNSDKYSKIPTH